MKKKYDYIVIGSGPAGYVSAVKAAQLGMKTLIIEKDAHRLGGTCLNEGCIPAKSLFRSAGLYAELSRQPDLFGAEDLQLKPSMKAFVDKSRKISSQLRKGLEYLFKKNRIELVIGKASFLDDHTITVASEKETKTYMGENFLIATGSSPKTLENISFDGDKILNSNHSIFMTKNPEKLLVLGGGAIGIEFASYFNTLGSDVTIAEQESRILPAEDRDASRALARNLEKNGIKIKTSTRLKTLKLNKETVHAQFEPGTGDLEEFSHVLIAIGRKSNTDYLGLPETGLVLGENGSIKVGPDLRTSMPHILAAGDVIGSPMLAHASYAEGELAAKTAAGKETEEIKYDSCPNAVYSSIQLASVGFTEQNTRDADIPYDVGKAFFRANGKAAVNGQSDGFVKLITEKRSGRLLGAHIVHALASELIHELVLAKRKGLTAKDLECTIHAHPTLSEIIPEAARSISSRLLHG